MEAYTGDEESCSKSQVSKASGYEPQRNSKIATNELTKTETKAVKVLRITVFALLVSVAGLVSAGVYIFSHQAEQAAGAEQYH